MILLETDKKFFLFNLILLVAASLYGLYFVFFNGFLVSKISKLSEAVFLIIALIFYLIFILAYLSSYFKIIQNNSGLKIVFPFDKSKSRNYQLSQISYISIIEYKKSNIIKNSFKEYRITIGSKNDEKIALIYAKDNQISNFRKDLEMLGVNVIVEVVLI